jgi:hypothetical protein
MASFNLRPPMRAQVFANSDATDHRVHFFAVAGALLHTANSVTNASQRFLPPDARAARLPTEGNEGNEVVKQKDFIL